MKRAISKSLLFFVAALLCVAGVASLKYRYSHHFSPPNLGLRGLAVDGGSDVLFVGSSVTRASYDVKRFEDLTGKRAYVLSYNALDPVYSYPLLKYILEEAEWKPQMVVMEASSAVVCIEPVLRDENLFFHAPPQLKCAYVKIIRADIAAESDPRSAWNTIARAVLADHRERTRVKETQRYKWRDLFDLLINSKNGDIFSSPVTNRLLRQHYYRGGFILGPPGHVSAQTFAAVKPSPELDKGPFRTEQLEALQKIFTLLNTHKVEGVFVMPALPAGVLNSPEVQAANQELQNMIENAGFQYLDGSTDFPTDDHRMYLDTRHLSQLGRKRFTEQIAPRFVELKRPVDDEPQP